jgi:hypothetical protein
MGRMQRERTSQFLQMGIFAVATVAVAFIGFYVLRNWGGGNRPYRMGVHFARASGVAQGSQVFLSGVEVGAVDEIRLLPDNSVDLILAIQSGTDIPKTATFSVRPSFTGDASVVITPRLSQLHLTTKPTPLPRDLVLAKRILPVSEQPTGTNPLGLEDMLAQGQELMHRSSGIISIMRGYKRPLLHDLQDSRSSAMAISLQMHNFSSNTQVSMRATALRLRSNVDYASTALHHGEHEKLAVLASSLNESATSMNASLSAFHATTTDARVRANMNASAQQMRAAMTNLGALQRQMHGLSSDQQTRLDLADASAQLQAALQKIHSLLNAR